MLGDPRGRRPGRRPRIIIVGWARLAAGSLPPHQICALELSARTIGSPALHPKAFANSGKFESGPSTLHRTGEWESVARLEGVQPESRQRVMARVRELMDAEAWADAVLLVLVLRKAVARTDLDRRVRENPCSTQRPDASILHPPG